jgi:hypothetical protein
MAGRTLADLVDAGGLAYAQSRLTRGDDDPEVMTRLTRLYPQYPSALLASVLELAHAEQRGRRELAAAQPGQILGPDIVPFIPGIPFGQYSVDVAFTPPTRSGLSRSRGFFRLDFDTLDIRIAHLLEAAGELTPVPGRWAEIRALLAGMPAGATASDLAALTGNAIIGRAAAFQGFGSSPIKEYLTRRALDIIITQLPLDESADVLFPSRWLQYKRLREIVDPLVLSLGRG